MTFDLAEGGELASLELHALRICSAAAARELAVHRPELAARADEALIDLADAECRLEEPRALLARLEGELAEVRRQLAEIQSVDQDAPLSWRVNARARHGALAEEERDLAGRTGIVGDILSPILAAARLAKMEAESAETALAEFDRALARPMDSDIGLATEAGQRFLLISGRWIRHLGADEQTEILGAASRTLITRALRDSGFGSEIQAYAVSRTKGSDPVQVGKDGLVFVSAPGWDGKSGKLHDLSHSPASAAAAAASLRWAAGAVGDPGKGLLTYDVKPMTAPPPTGRDLSGLPGDFR